MGAKSFPVDERIQGGTGLTMVLVFYLNRMLGAMGIGQCASTRVMAHPNECVGFTVCSNYRLSDGTRDMWSCSGMGKGGQHVAG